MLFFRFIIGWTRGALSLCFSCDTKLGRSYKLSTSKMSKFNLTQVSSAVSSSNLILHQIFPLYGIPKESITIQ